MMRFSFSYYLVGLSVVFLCVMTSPGLALEPDEILVLPTEMPPEVSDWQNIICKKDLLKDLLQKQETLTIALRDKNNDTEKKQTQLKNELSRSC